MRLAFAGLILSSVAAATAYGQAVISATSGVVHYVEGNASIQDKPVDVKFGHFPDVKPDQTLRTEEGRAEVLLVPGTILRLAENSAVRMISNRLSDTKVEFLQGEILIEAVNFIKDSASAQTQGNVVSVVYKGSTTTIEKGGGVFVFNSEPGRLRVFDGEALVSCAAGQLTLKKGKETLLDGALMAEKFDSKTGDELTRWSSRRSSYLAMANVAAAKSVYSNSSLWSSYSGSGGWMYNSMFGMYSYVPFGGMAYSPFGYSFFSPYSVYQYYPGYYGYGSGYYPGYYYGGGSGGGITTGGGKPVGNTGGNSAVAAARTGHAIGNFGHGLSSGGGSSSVGGSLSGARGGSMGASSIPSGGGYSGNSGGGFSGAGGGGGSRGGGMSSGGGGAVSAAPAASGGGGGSRGK